jgi:hypothetical protein
METYLLIVSVALFLGVMGIIAMLEQRRKIEQAHFDQVHQTLAGCLEALKAVQAGNEAQSGQLIEALAQLQATIEVTGNNATEARQAVAAEVVRTTEKSVGHLEAVIVQQQKALDATLVRASETTSESAGLRSKELLAEVQRTTKAVEALKASLEESVSFSANP